MENIFDKVNKVNEQLKNSQDVLSSKVSGFNELNNKLRSEGGSLDLGASTYNINLDNYSPYMENVFINEGLDKERAKRQSGWEQLGHAARKFVPNTLLTVASNIGAIADVEDYLNQNDEVGNWLTSWAEEQKQAINEANPIYRVNPEQPLDLSDSGWWYQNGSMLAESAAAFVATGYASGAAISSILGKSAQAAKWLSTFGKTSKLGTGGIGQQTVNFMSTVGNAAALNQAESIGVATSVYDNVYNQTLKDTDGDEELARRKAADAASYSVNLNRANILLNLTSASHFLRPFKHTRKLVDNPSIKRSLARVGTEGVQEYTEEVVNLYSENEALDYGLGKRNRDGFRLDRLLQEASTIEGVEAGILGFVGGVAQTAGTLAAQRGRTKEQRERFNEQVQQIKDNEALFDPNGTLSIGELFNTAAEQQGYLEKINELEQIGTEEALTKAEALKEKSLQHLAYKNFEKGTTESLINSYKQLSELSEEVAETRGLPKNYKEKANQAIDTIEKLEKEYINATSYANPDVVYQNRANKIAMNKALTEVRSSLLEAKSQATQAIEERLASKADPLTLEKGQFKLGYDINNLEDNTAINEEQTELYSKFYNDIKNMEEVQKVEQLQEMEQNLFNGIAANNKEYQTITKDSFQSKLTESKKQLAKQYKELIKKHEASEEAANAVNEARNKQNESKPEPESEPDVVEDEQEIGFETQDIASKGKDTDADVVVRPRSRSELNSMRRDQLVPLFDAIFPDQPSNKKTTKADMIKRLREELFPKDAPDNVEKVIDAADKSSNVSDMYNSKKDATLDDKVNATNKDLIKSDAGTKESNGSYLVSYASYAIATQARKFVEQQRNGEPIKINISNFLNSNYNSNILLKGEFGKGHKLKLRVVDSFTDDNGNVITLDQMREREIEEGTPNMLIPIEIVSAETGEKLGYVHTSEFINPDRVVNVEEDLAQLTRLRNAIVNNGGEITATVTHKTNGVLIRDKDNSYITTTEAFPDKDIRFAYLSSGMFYDDFQEGDRTPFSGTVLNNPKEQEEGYTYAMLPVENGHIGVPLKINKVGEQYADTMVKAIEAWKRQDINNPIVKNVKKHLGIDLTTDAGIRKFLSRFIYIYNVKDNGKTFASDLRSAKSGNKALTVSNNGAIEIGKSGGEVFSNTNKDVLFITKDSSDAITNVFLNNLRNHISNMYMGFNEQYFGSKDFQLPIINNDGTVEFETKSYADHIKEHTTTNLRSVEIEDKAGNKVYSYTVSNRILFYPNVEIGTQSATDTNNNQVAADSSPVKTTRRHKLPNGNEVDLDEDIDTEDGDVIINYLPDTNTNTKTQSSILVQGISARKQNIVIDAIASQINARILEEQEVSPSIINDILNEWKESYQYLSENHGSEKVREEFKKILLGWDVITKLTRFRLGTYKTLKRTENNNRFVEQSESDQSLEESLEENAENDGSKEIYDSMHTFKINHKLKVPDKLRAFLSLIKVPTDKKYLGNDTYLNYNIAYDDLISILSGTEPNFDKMMDVLKKYEGKSAKPWIDDVIAKLQDGGEILQNQFVKAMTKHHVKMFFVKVDISGNTINTSVISANRNSMVKKITSGWEEGLIRSDLVYYDSDAGGNKYNQEKVEALKKKINNLRLIQNRDAQVQEVKEIFEILNLQTSDQTIDDLVEGKIEDRRGIPMSFQRQFSREGIFDAIQRSFHDKIIQDEDIEVETYVNNSSIMSLAKRDSLYRANEFNSSFISGNSTIYSHGLNNYIVQRFGQITNDKELLKLLSEQSFSKDSLWLEKLFDKETGELKDNAFTRNFEMGYVSLDALTKKNSKLKESIDNLSAIEHEATKLYYYQNGGQNISNKEGKAKTSWFFYPTLSDKRKVVLIKANRESVDYDTELGTITEDTAKLIYDKIFIPELMRVIGSKDIGIEGYDEGRSKFLLLPYINKLGINPNSIATQFTDKDNQYNQQVLNAIKEETGKLIANKIAYWSENNIQMDQSYMGSDTKIQQAATDYVVNYMLANTNMLQLMIGDPALYFKKSGKRIDTSLEVSTETELDNDIQETYTNLGKRLAADNAPGDEFNQDSNETVRYAVVKDSKRSSLRSEYYKRLAKKGGWDAKGYDNINATDAQEFTTWREHLDILFRKGDLTQSQYDSLSNKLSNPNYKLLDSDIALLAINPMKPVYSNMVNNNGTEYRFYVKSSSIPLIPQLTKGLELDKIRIAMEGKSGNDIQRLTFESAVKVGKPKKLAKIFNKDGTVIDKGLKEMASSLVVVPRRGFKIQQEVPYKDSDFITDGSQHRKLIFNNLPNDLKVKYYGKQITVGELKKLYYQNYDKVFKMKKEQLMKDIGADENGNVTTDKLQDIIKEEAIDRGFNLNELIGFDIVQRKDGEREFRVPVAYSLSSNKIQYLLNAIVDSRVRKILTPGRSYVLVTEEGFKATNDSNNIIWSEGYDGQDLQPNQVILPWRFKDANGNILDTRKYTKKDAKGRTVIDSKKIPDDLLRRLGYRIPTQGHNSMASLEVIGFLKPSIKSDMVIASRDFVTQMGSDFDVDKLYTQEFAYEEQSNGSLKMIDDDSSATSKLTASMLGNENAVKEDFKIQLAKLQNDILEAYFAVMDSEDDIVKQQIHEPINHDSLKDLADTISSRTAPNYFISDDYQSYKYVNARSGEVAIGAFAVISTFNALAQDTEAYFEEPITLGRKTSTNLNDPRTVNGKFKSSVISKFLSAAVDNEKDQILDKLNINEYTFPVINSLLLMGFEEDAIVSLINQPIIFEYIKEQTKLANRLSTKFQKYDVYNKVLETFNISTTGETDFDSINNQFSNTSTKDLLAMASVLANKTDLTKYPNGKNLQHGALMMFMKLEGIGDNIRGITSAINTEAKGLGKTLEANKNKIDRIIKLNQNESVKNIQSIVGDILYQAEYDKLSDSNKAEYYKLHNTSYYLRPNNINGSAIVHALNTSMQLWSNEFPALYDQTVSKMIDNIQKVASVNLVTSESVSDFRNRVWNNMKSYIYDLTVNQVYGVDTFEERKRLMIHETQVDPDTQSETIINESLARRLARLKRTNPAVRKNPFLKKLITKFNQPNTVEYVASQGENVDETIIHAGFMELVNSDEAELRQLADDLIKYSLLNGGNVSPFDFNKFLPIEYLEKIGILSYIRNLSEGDVFATLKEEDNQTSFFHSFFMNNEDVIPIKEGVDIERSREDNNLIYPKNIDQFKSGKIILPFVRIKDGKNNLVTYQYLPELGAYQKTNSLGYYRGVKEFYYSFNTNKNVRSFIPSNNTDFKSDVARNHRPEVSITTVNQDGLIDTPKSQVNNSLGIRVDSELSRDQVITALDKILLNPIGNEQHKLVAKLLMSKLGDDLLVRVDNTLGAKGRYIHKDRTVTLNLNKVQSDYDLSKTLLHELTHHVIRSRWRNADPKLKKRIEELRVLAQNKIKDQYGIENVKELVDKVKAGEITIEPDLFNAIYGAYNEQEFISEVLTNKRFQDTLKGIKLANKSNIFNKIVEVFLKVLGIDTDTALGDAVNTIIQITESKPDSKGTDSFVRRTINNISYTYFPREGKVIKTNTGKVVDNELEKSKVILNYLRRGGTSVKIDGKRYLYNDEVGVNVFNEETGERVESSNNLYNTIIERAIKQRNNNSNNNDSTLIDFLPDVRALSNIQKQLNDARIAYRLKAINILSTDKAKQIFEKGKKANWNLDKILTELQVPKEQKQIILDKGTKDREEIITSLLADNSFVVEINTAKEKTENIKQINATYFEVDGIDYTEAFGSWFKNEGTIKISYEEYKKALEKYNQQNIQEKPTLYYSNLTVAGGTNYTENEIATPAITPSIKGHAQFATSSGIGWFRSDDKAKFITEEERSFYSYDDPRATEELGEATKTRRILEVQSDLFQKGRDKKLLTKSEKLEEERLRTEEFEGQEREDYLKELETKESTLSQNQFLQLLNKDGNWVRFFIQSIVQDSARKGYEKVLFPKGDTAAKVEGHTTLEEFKKQKEDKIKELENQKFRLDNTWLVRDIFDTFGENDKEFTNEEEAQKYANENSTQSNILAVSKIKSDQEIIDNEINQLKQELERVETEGFGALRPIYNFYETTVTNILKKNGYSPKVITDEYGNTWNEVEIKEEFSEEIDLMPNIESINKTDLYPEIRTVIKARQQSEKSIEEQIETEVNDEFFDATPTDRFYKLINSKKLQLVELKKQAVVAKNKDNRKQLSILNDKVEKLENELKELNSAVILEDIVKYGEDDIAELEVLLSKDKISPDQLRNARKIAELWTRSKELFFTKEERGSEQLNNLFNSIIDKAAIYLETIQEKEQKVLQDFVNRTTGKNYTLDQLLALSKDVTFAESQVLSIDRYGNTILDTMSKAVKDANSLAKEEARLLFQELDKRLKSIEGKVSKDFDIFLQKDSKGRNTGNLVFRYSQEFFNEREFHLNKARKRNSVAGWQSYFKWKKENENLFDVRMLLPISTIFEDQFDVDINNTNDKLLDKQKEDHIKLLKSTLGDRGYNDILKRAKKSIELYKEDYEAQKERLETEGGLEGDALKARLQGWVEQNSPYWYAKSWEKGEQVTTNTNKGYNYSHSVPRKDVGNGKWYDKSFEAIEKDADLLEFYDYIIETFGNLKKMLPEDQANKLRVNTLPQVMKSIAEKFSDDGMKAGLSGIWDNVIEATSTNELSEVEMRIVDPLTDQAPRTFRFSFIPDNTKTLSNLKQSALIKFRQENGREANDRESQEITNKIKAELAKEKSTDIPKVLKAFAMMSLSYKHKARIEDEIRIAQDIMNDSIEGITVPGESRFKKLVGGRFSTKSKEESIPYIKAAMDNFVDVALYGMGREREGVFGKKKARTSQEKARTEELDRRIEGLREELEAGKITTEKFETDFARLTAEKEAIGSRLSADQIGDAALKLVQLKGMGWNAIAAIANIGFGSVSNLVEAAGGEYYTISQLFKANAMVQSSILKNWSLGSVEIGQAKKIRALMDRFDVLKTSAHELYRPSLESTFAKNTKRYQPYQMQKHTEYLNQAPLMIATMMNQEVILEDGTKMSMWDAFDENGEWKVKPSKEWQGSVDDELSNKKMLKYKNMLDALIIKNHGNYDPDKPLLIKKKIAGRMMSQFRTWMFEGFANRFEGEKFDEALDKTRKGRYRSLWDIVSNKEERINYMKYLIGKGERGQLSEVDIANMRRNFMELGLATALTALILMLKAMDDDDDDDTQWSLLVLTNLVIRVHTDIQFYLSPTAFDDITRQLVPATALITDTISLLEASGKLITGNDLIEGGIYSGESRFTRELLDWIPLGKQIEKTRRLGKQVID